MLYPRLPTAQTPLRAAITAAYRMDETDAVENIVEIALLPNDVKQHIENTARQLVEKVRAARIGQGGVDAFMQTYDLSSEEGIALMCLAEALLRVPDSKTIDQLIRDKIGSANWAAHLGQSESLFVNAATWALMLTGKIVNTEINHEKHFGAALMRLAGRSGEPVIRKAVASAMKILGKQFVMGRKIIEAIKRAEPMEQQGYRFSYDMLGEAARTAEDANRYFIAYQQAIEAIGKAANNKGVIDGPGISIKLSALHPRYEFAKHKRVITELTPLLLALAKLAKQYNISLTVDAEEANRLDLSLDIIEKVFSDPALADWDGFGLAVQSYQKRAIAVIDWIIDLTKRQQRRIMVRLIKGAYWDSEIKQSQEMGFEGYPVFTRKNNTDVSFIACAKKLLAAGDLIYPMFATHNAHSVATILELTRNNTHHYEFQCLHGMGQSLYDQIVGPKNLNIACRVYAPVGSHEDLLPYLVRRLLENGANTSFVNRIVDEKAPISDIIADPLQKVCNYSQKSHPYIPLPAMIYGISRRNAKGIDLSNRAHVIQLAEQMEQADQTKWQAEPIIANAKQTPYYQDIKNPADQRHTVGIIAEATKDDVEQALQQAAKIAESWDKTPVTDRAAYLDRIADLYEQHFPQLMTLAVREAGKTINDAVAEVREAIDFCRYYALRARIDLAKPVSLPGPTGESNRLEYHGRGPIACISPWNFPLAIFTGQITAALVAGNPVLAKPAEQTPLIAAYAVRLMLEAGIPAEVIQLLPGRGEIVGAALVADERIKGVMFTGSTETARGINKTLANRAGPIVPFIAETGGQNAMIVDSSALPEQVIIDVLNSAFGSTGQRCSALRVLFLQEEVADKMITMLQGAMAELEMGDPSLLATDIGPVIDYDALTMLTKHAERMHKEAKLIYRVKQTAACEYGFFFSPCAFEINSLEQLTREVFGPVLHVIRYAKKDLAKVINAINNTGYGLTLGIHSRIEENIRYIQQHLHVGNTYVNRNIIGAVVGVQPFGGEGLSGTGPKAGGPNYLHRLVTERTICINTTAAGGNATLLSLKEEG